MRNSKGFETKLIHAGEPSPRIANAVVTPIFQSATFEYGDETTYHDIKYIRLNNTPNHQVLHQKLAVLEGGEAALVASSGMAIISATLLSFLKTSDHVLVQKNLYGGTHALITQDFAELGITYDFFDSSVPGNWKSLLRPSTKLIYVETISNPLIQIPDLKAVTDFAKTNRLVSVIDNTFASPANYRPLEYGFDLSIHSATKYLNGHSDIVAGAVIGTKKHIDAITHKLNHLGGALDPHACFLLHRGLKTLSVRIKHQNESARTIAEFLDGHPNVLNVNYPGLESHPQHLQAKECFDGFGGMISFQLKGGAQAAAKLVEGVRIFIHAPSLGGVESLITRPASTTHRGLSSVERNEARVTDDLVRLSIGLESSEDLIADLRNSL